MIHNKNITGKVSWQDVNESKCLDEEQNELKTSMVCKSCEGCIPAVSGVCYKLNIPSLSMEKVNCFQILTLGHKNPGVPALGRFFPGCTRLLESPQTSQVSISAFCYLAILRYRFQNRSQLCIIFVLFRADFAFWRDAEPSSPGDSTLQAAINSPSYPPISWFRQEFWKCHKLINKVFVFLPPFFRHHCRQYHLRPAQDWSI